MTNFTIKRGMKLTAEQIARLDALSEMSDDEIDYSDIPKITHEEFQRAIARKRAKLREKNLKIA